MNQPHLQSFRCDFGCPSKDSLVSHTCSTPLARLTNISARGRSLISMAHSPALQAVAYAKADRMCALQPWGDRSRAHGHDRQREREPRATSRLTSCRLRRWLRVANRKAFATTRRRTQSSHRHETRRWGADEPLRRRRSSSTRQGASTKIGVFDDAHIV
jgi:hypothetical protein